MHNETAPSRTKIADIIRDAGTVGGEEAGPSIGDLAGVGALFGQSTAMASASIALGEALGERFHLHAEGQIERVFSAPYATVARALVLALHANKHRLVSAFDTATGSALEAQAAMTLFHNAATITLLLADVDPATTRVTGRSDLHAQIIDLGANKQILNGIYAKADDYLKLLGT